MMKVIIHYDENKNVRFSGIANFLVSYNIMTLENAHSLYTEFTSGRDVAIDIPDEVAARFRDLVNDFDCKCELAEG